MFAKLFDFLKQHKKASILLVIVMLFVFSCFIPMPSRGIDNPETVFHEEKYSTYMEYKKALGKFQAYPRSNYQDFESYAYNGAVWGYRPTFDHWVFKWMCYGQYSPKSDRYIIKCYNHQRPPKLWDFYKRILEDLEKIPKFFKELVRKAWEEAYWSRY